MTNQVEIFAPHENVNDDVVTIVELFAADGDFVAKDARLLMLETSKSTFEVYAPQAGYVKFLVELHADVPIERPLCVLSEMPQAATPQLAVAAESAASPPPPGVHSRTENGHAATFAAEPRALIGIADAGSHSIAIEAASTAPPASGQRASREALALMEKASLRLEDFPHLGLIRARDVLVRSGHAHPGPTPVPSLPVPTAQKAHSRSAADLPVPEVAHTRKKLSRSKRTEIARLVSASASLTSQVSVLVPSRGVASRLSADAATAGQMSSRLIFEAARLLRQFPDLNAMYEHDHVVHYDEVNVGYALDLGQGLKVPVFRGADQTALEEIHHRKQEFILKYLDGGLGHSDLDRGTFTITDLSDYRAWMFNPLVNAGQAAILGVGGELAVGDGRFVYPLILAFDHRLTEGLSATRFLQALSQRLEAHELVLERQLGGPGENQSQSEPFCRYCRRTLSELKSLQAHLLRTAGDEGKESLLCTICIAGW